MAPLTFSDWLSRKWWKCGSSFTGCNRAIVQCDSLCICADLTENIVCRKPRVYAADTLGLPSQSIHDFSRVSAKKFGSGSIHSLKIGFCPGMLIKISVVPNFLDSFYRSPSKLYKIAETP